MKLFYRVIRVILIFAILLLVTYFLLPEHISKALRYQNPGIDDYEIFNSHIVQSGAYQPWKISKDYNNKNLSDSIIQEIEKYKTTSFLVIQNNKIIHEQYWDGKDEKSVANCFSVTKSIVSLLVGAAISEGKIKSVEQFVYEYIPEFSEGLKKKIKIKHLLNMSSGIDWDESYSNLFSETTKLYYGNKIKKMVYNLDMKTEPGTLHNYNSANTQILSYVLEKATGMTISDYASEKLWKPLGARYNASWSLDDEAGDERAFCCFNSNARDFARLGQLMLDSGKWKGKQLINQDYLLESIKAANELKDEKGNSVYYYGYSWWIADYRGMKINYARGVLGQYIFTVPEKNAVIVRIGHKKSIEYLNYHPLDVYTYLDAAMEVLD
ncbi:MAG: beta-lactamase family protein [Saprospiraceae bacterium]|nr:beta-lactamase family protein [Saprospiraceae bacterium]